MQVLKNLSANAFRFTVGSLIGFALTRLLLHHLGESDYGLYTLGFSLASILVLSDFGVATYLVKFTAEMLAGVEIGARRQILGEAPGLFALLGLAVAGLLGLLAFPLARIFALPPHMVRLAAWLFILHGLLMIVRFPAIALGSFLEGAQIYVPMNAVIILGNLSYAALVVLLVQRGAGVIAVSGAISLLHLITLLGFLWICQKNFRPYRLRLPRLATWIRWRPIYRAGLWFFLHDLLSLLVYSIDLLLVSFFFSPVITSSYAVGQKIPLVLFSLVWTAASVFYPYLTQLRVVELNERISDLLESSLRTIVLTVFPAVFLLALLADPLIRIWIGKSYGLAAIILQILLFAVLCDSLQVIPVQVLYAAGETKFLVRVQFFNALLNVGLSVLLAKLRGPRGVAEATLVVTAVSSVIMIPRAFWLTRSGTRPLWDVLRRTAPPILASVACWWLLKLFLQNSLGQMGQLLVTAAIYTASCWYLGLTPAERLRLNSLLRYWQ